MLISWIKRRRSREERARKVVQGIRQRLKAGHMPDRKKRKGRKKHPIALASKKLRQLGDVHCDPPRLIAQQQGF